jgi:hypothetical protein
MGTVIYLLIMKDLTGLAFKAAVDARAMATCKLLVISSLSESA